MDKLNSANVAYQTERIETVFMSGAGIHSFPFGLQQSNCHLN